MPEGYTHIRTAKRAALKMGLDIKNKNIFGAGANGPDILFCYKVWMKGSKRDYDLPKIGGRLHDENTGVFLRTIVENAKTRAEKEYVLGFLSHYAADCTIHPYIVMLTQEGQSYHREGGHGYSEIAIDSFLHKKDTGSPLVKADDNSPALTKEEKEQAAGLLSSGIKEALGEEIPGKVIEKTFDHTRYMRRMFVSPTGFTYALFYLIEPAFGKRGFITGHITPRKLEKLPLKWTDPFTKEERGESLEDLLLKAEELSVKYMGNALKYWEGEISISELGKILGSSSYLKGIPDEMSCPK